jgi:hypothetical protein
MVLRPPSRQSGRTALHGADSDGVKALLEARADASARDEVRFRCEFFVYLGGEHGGGNILRNHSADHSARHLQPPTRWRDAAA